MVSYKLNSPGIEINESDRSRYDFTTDYSLPNTPICLVAGFADKGENYKIQWINSKSTFIEKYGIPTNIPEQYFYNAAMEILNNNATLITYKFPYDNIVKDKLTYITYNFSKNKKILNKIDINNSYKTFNDIKNVLKQLLDNLNIKYTDNDLKTINDIKNICYNLQTNFNINHDDILIVDDIIKAINRLIQEIKTEYSDISKIDSSLTSYIEITQDEKLNGLISLDEFDNLLTQQNTNFLKKSSNDTCGTITIVNIKNNTYNKTTFDKELIEINDNNNIPYSNNACLGIIPIIISPANALYYQKKLENDNINIDDFQLLSNNLKISNREDKIISVKQEIFNKKLAKQLKTNKDDLTKFNVDISWSNDFSSTYFPEILLNENNNFNTDHLKKIGLIIVNAFQDSNNKINFEVLESYVGSLDKNAKDDATHSSIFIDNIVNTQSQYVRIFTNIDKNELEKTCFIGIKNQNINSMGFYEFENTKDISYKNSILDSMNKMFDVLKNTNTSNIDIIIDAGMSNIAQYFSDTTNLSNTTDQEKNNLYSDIIETPKKWFDVIYMFDNFCKNIRKDCIFIADSPKPFCLTGDQKKIRFTKPLNTVENSIISKIKYLSNLNSSYTAGYCNWFYCRDYYTNDFFWCPPSIKAAGIYCQTDAYFHSWDAPAGMTRGIVSNTYDIAFNPSQTEANNIYLYGWNYAVNYPLNGIVLEGQKTFQKQKTALDRINVRRLLIYLEKRTIQIARLFVYEKNTAYLRQRLVDTLTSIFENVKNENGISEYAIQCNEKNNTYLTIDKNELHISIAIKPIKTIEYILTNFIVTNQTANVYEEVLK